MKTTFVSLAVLIRHCGIPMMVNDRDKLDLICKNNYYDFRNIVSVCQNDNDNGVSGSIGYQSMNNQGWLVFENRIPQKFLEKDYVTGVNRYF